MRALVGTAIGFVALASISTPALGQAAAETAVILSGTGAGQAKAARGLGNAVSRSVNSAASQIRATGQPRRGVRGTARRSGPQGPVIAEGVDALEGTDATAYTTDTGATIKFSGSFRPSATTRCKENCDTESAAPED